MTTARIRVLCVDDHRIVREGIALIISRQPDMKVVGFAATANAVVYTGARPVFVDAAANLDMAREIVGKVRAELGILGANATAAKPASVAAVLTGAVRWWFSGKARGAAPGKKPMSSWKP